LQNLFQHSYTKACTSENFFDVEYLYRSTWQSKQYLAGEFSLQLIAFSTGNISDLDIEATLLTVALDGLNRDDDCGSMMLICNPQTPLD